VKEGHIYVAKLAATGIRVRLYRLDDLFPDLNPSFIKCDVEGAELSVIRGAQALIGRSFPAWLMETQNSEVFIEMSRLATTPSERAALEEIVYLSRADNETALKVVFWGRAR